MVEVGSFGVFSWWKIILIDNRWILLCFSFNNSLFLLIPSSNPQPPLPFILISHQRPVREARLHHRRQRSLEGDLREREVGSKGRHPNERLDVRVDEEGGAREGRSDDPPIGIPRLPRRQGRRRRILRCLWRGGTWNVPPDAFEMDARAKEGFWEAKMGEAFEG